MEHLHNLSSGRNDHKSKRGIYTRRNIKEHLILDQELNLWVGGPGTHFYEESKLNLPWRHTGGPAIGMWCQTDGLISRMIYRWMGDDGFLWKMSGDLRAFNQVGDLTTFEGKVTKKYIEDGRCCVDIEAWATNQRGQKSMPPNMSTVILPSKEHGPVVFPNADPKLMVDVENARPLKEMIAEGLI